MKVFLFFISVFIMGCAQLPNKRTDKLSILQGVTHGKEVEFSIVAMKGLDLRFELRTPEDKLVDPVEVKIVTRDDSDYAVYKVLFARDPAQEYNLFVYDGVRIVDQRLIGRGQRLDSKLKLAVVSGSNPYFHEHYQIWTTLIQKNPEYLLLLGNNVFPDMSSKQNYHETNPKVLWQHYVDQRQTLPLFFQEKLIPTHALWGDHDFGQENANETYEYKEESKKIFETFYAQSLSEDDWTQSFGVSGLLTLGDFNLYFLDGMSFRSEDETGPHLGIDQRTWLYSKLKEEKAPSFLIKGDAFFGDNAYELKHPTHFQLFVNELKLIPTPYVFLSGSDARSGIMQFPRSLFGKPSFEITSGNMQGLTDEEPEEGHSSWSVVENKNHLSFTIIQNEAKNNHWFMDVENIGETGELYYRRELAVYIQDLQDNLKETRKRRSGRRRYRRIRHRPRHR